MVKDSFSAEQFRKSIEDLLTKAQTLVSSVEQCAAVVDPINQLAAHRDREQQVMNQLNPNTDKEELRRRQEQSGLTQTIATDAGGIGGDVAAGANRYLFAGGSPRFTSQSGGAGREASRGSKAIPFLRFILPAWASLAGRKGGRGAEESHEVAVCRLAERE